MSASVPALQLRAWDAAARTTFTHAGLPQAVHRVMRAEAPAPGALRPGHAGQVRAAAPHLARGPAGDCQDSRDQGEQPQLALPRYRWCGARRATCRSPCGGRRALPATRWVGACARRRRRSRTRGRCCQRCRSAWRCCRTPATRTMRCAWLASRAHKHQQLLQKRAAPGWGGADVTPAGNLRRARTPQRRRSSAHDRGQADAAGLTQLRPIAAWCCLPPRPGAAPQHGIGQLLSLVLRIHELHAVNLPTVAHTASSTIRQVRAPASRYLGKGDACPGLPSMSGCRPRVRHGRRHADCIRAAGVSRSGVCRSRLSFSCTAQHALSCRPTLPWQAVALALGHASFPFSVTARCLKCFPACCVLFHAPLAGGGAHLRPRHAARRPRGRAAGRARRARRAPRRGLALHAVDTLPGPGRAVGARGGRAQAAQGPRDVGAAD